jgi:DtxR family Mn-dependent transcriptional regulator
LNYVGPATSPLKSREEEAVEHALGVVWELRERGATAEAEVERVLGERVVEEALSSLRARGLAEAGSPVTLTAAGEARAREVTRRHLLAERLLADLLALRGDALDASACQWEHVLSAEVTRSICILLGHPRSCPHGRAIPPGACCRGGEATLGPLLLPLDQLPPGEEARIAYLALADVGLLHRLLSLGLVPGAAVHVRGQSPACVVQVGETVVALEPELAGAVVARRRA